MKEKIVTYKSCAVFVLSVLLMCLTSSCNLFSSRREFEKNLRAENRYYIRLVKANDHGQITAEVICPDSKRLYIKDCRISDYLSEVQMKSAVYVYIGDWEESEKRFKQNYDEEYREWYKGMES